jgi:putative phosphoribosyl transferase
MTARPHEISVVIEPGLEIKGTLCIPEASLGLVIVAHPTAGTRRLPRERLVAAVLERAGLATLLLDLLTPSEEHSERFRDDVRRGKLRFDIPLLAGRMLLSTSWLRRQPETHALPVGYFGNDTAAAAALVAAAHESDRVRAVVARGGRADLAGNELSEVRAPTLLVVGSADVPVMAATRAALPKLNCETRLELIPGAAHLFEQSGALELAAFRARDWFLRHLPLSPLLPREATPPASRRDRPPLSAARH